MEISYPARNRLARESYSTRPQTPTAASSPFFSPPTTQPNSCSWVLRSHTRQLQCSIPRWRSFSPDGQTLYIAEAFGGGRVITALAAATMLPIGQAPDLSIQGIGSSLEDLDTNNFLYAVANRGITRIDVAQTFSLSPNAPLFANAPAVQPSEGANVGGTTVTLNGSNFSGSAQVRFGNQNAVNAQSLSATQL
jgi:IPT/TIG domain